MILRLRPKNVDQNQRDKEREDRSAREQHAEPIKPRYRAVRIFQRCWQDDDLVGLVRPLAYNPGHDRCSNTPTPFYARVRSRRAVYSGFARSFRYRAHLMLVARLSRVGVNLMKLTSSR